MQLRRGHVRMCGRALSTILEVAYLGIIHALRHRASSASAKRPQSMKNLVPAPTSPSR